MRPVRPRLVHVFGFATADRAIQVQLLVAAIRVVVLRYGHLDGPHAAADQVYHSVVRDLRHRHSVDGYEKISSPESGLICRRIGHYARQDAGLLP